jgi:hypothetical protein
VGGPKGAELKTLVPAELRRELLVLVMLPLGGCTDWFEAKGEVDCLASRISGWVARILQGVGGSLLLTPRKNGSIKVAASPSALGRKGGKAFNHNIMFPLLAREDARLGARLDVQPKGVNSFSKSARYGRLFIVGGVRLPRRWCKR